MEFVNLTPHEIKLVTDEVERVFPPSGQVARVKMEYEEGEVGGYPLVTAKPSGIEGLPEPKEGTVYIVSAMVAQHTARADVVAPDTGPQSAIRDESGRIVAVKRFIRYGGGLETKPSNLETLRRVANAEFPLAPTEPTVSGVLRYLKNTIEKMADVTSKSESRYEAAFSNLEALTTSAFAGVVSMSAISPKGSDVTSQAETIHDFVRLIARFAFLMGVALEAGQIELTDTGTASDQLLLTVLSMIGNGGEVQ